MADESKIAKVHWREWSDEAFADAHTQDKPVLLGISAVWCHWCHVMDRGVPGDPVHTGVYNNEQLAGYINANFIPIRVDNDQRPDINARYNMGGWPTTCFLTPDGDVIYGGTYFAPSQMRQLLPRVVEVWRDDRKEILAKLGEREERTVNDAQAAGEKDEAAVASRLSAQAGDIIGSVVTLITRNFDARHGGLGHDQKFPMSDAWALLLAAYAQTQDQQLLDQVTKTLVAMGTKGMYDLVAGGWFRYSTTPDWSVPHFEKMLEDHGRLLPVYLSALALVRRGGTSSPAQLQTGPAGVAQVQSTAEILENTIRAALGYLTTTLLRDQVDLSYFAGSQDADEAYYLLSGDERAKLEAPFIDWRLYADWNALMVSALLQASTVLDEPAHAQLAQRIWRTLVSRCLNGDGSVTHSLTARDGAMQPSPAALRGQLGDQAALARASLDLAQTAPDMRDECLAVARQTLTFALTELAAPGGGGFYDSPTRPDAMGMLRTRIQPIFDNCAIAEALMTLSYLTEDDGDGDGDSGGKKGGPSALRTTAQATLLAFRDDYARYREHGAPYALAVLRATQVPDEVMVVAHRALSGPFIQAALATYSPWRIVRVLDPERDARIIAVRSFPVNRLPVTFVCRGVSCSAPIYAAADLGQLG